MPPGPGADDRGDHRDNNLVSTRRLAESAARAGVKRFVYLSSVRAQTGPVSDRPLTEDLPAAPTDAYGRSKREAEQAVAAMRSILPRLIISPSAVRRAGILAARAGVVLWIARHRPA